VVAPLSGGVVGGPVVAPLAGGPVVTPLAGGIVGGPVVGNSVPVATTLLNSAPVIASAPVVA